MKTIGVLTSGGDAPGMNAAIRAVVRAGCENGMRVMGIRRGYNGLMQGDMYEMNLRSVSNIINRGGTVLYSARSPEFKTEEGLQKALNVAKEVGMEGIVVIGGDGSFRGARDLSLRGLPCVGVPGTIDNDIACCDYTIGYDTAMNTVLAMVDRLRHTTEPHDRRSAVDALYEAKRLGQ
ncbi:MAG: 6-phosphofructokinase, partial [Candidatus Fimenecus sp.]